jgi:cyclopropane fatty-acyl-phospholipid synthase-like methyltransferase
LADGGFVKDYKYSDASPACGHAFILPGIVRILGELKLEPDKRAIFDLGCGNGSAGNALAKAGYRVTGVDPSDQGIGLAKRTYPNLELHQGSSEDDLAAIYGRFPIVVSIEVIEHVFSPKRFASTLYELAEPGGVAVITTPFHGYWKNLCISILDKWDWHHTALWEGGHIKFWSKKTLSILLEDAGFHDIRYLLVGRIPLLAKSMIAVAHKPG